MPTEPYALCPMPHALCPVVPHLSEKGYTFKEYLEASRISTKFAGLTKNNEL
ncbi:MAG: hypothetical protein WBL95_05515 [Microcoleus sp.]